MILKEIPQDKIADRNLILESRKWKCLVVSMPMLIFMNFVHTKMKKDYLMTQAATYKGRYLESVIMLSVYFVPLKQIHAWIPKGQILSPH